MVKSTGDTADRRGTFHATWARRILAYALPLPAVMRLLPVRFRDIVFIHINKTGGSSIEAALKLPFQHKTALELMHEIGDRRWNRSFRFAFVRNPWDKVASHYSYRVQTNQTGLGTNPIPFTEWVRRSYGEQDRRYYDQPKMFMPQLNWVADEQGRVLMDMVGRYESLSEDFERVCEAIGRRASLPHLKKSANTDYRRKYDSATVDIVARWFEKDIHAFEYRFE